MNKRLKYPIGGDVDPNDPGADLTVEQWNALKQKYAGNLPKVEGGNALNKRMEWTTWAKQSLPTGGTPSQLAAKASKATGLNNPGLLLSSSLEEGVGNRFKGDEGYSQAYDDAKIDQKAYPVDAFRSYGLDQIGGRVDEFISRGYLPKDFKSKLKPFDASNENDEQKYYGEVAKIAQKNNLVGKDFKYKEDQAVYDQLDQAVKGYKGQLPTKAKSAHTAAFVDDESAFMAKAAFLRAEQDNVNTYAKKKGYNLTPEEKDFFTLASYNGGAGNGQSMLDYYGGKKLLGNNGFLKDKDAAKGQIYDNIIPRFAGANLFNKEQGYFAYGGKMSKKPGKYQDGTEDPILGTPGPQLNKDAKNVGVDVFGNALTAQVPINPGAPADQQIFAINQQKSTQNQQSPTVPLEQFYDQYTDIYGNKQLKGTGQYVNEQGQVNTLEQQQSANDQISADNLATATRRESNMDQAEMYGSIGITAINSYFNKKNAAKEERKNRRSALMQEMDVLYNPYSEGTGSQAIFKSGGWIAGAVNPAHKGYCTPMTKSTCTPRRKAFARRAKAHFHEDGGEIDGQIDGQQQGFEITDGGKSTIISGNNHSNPMLEFTGKEHGEGGIGVAYGGKISEVEDKEIGWVDEQGGLNIFGKLKIPGTNQTFRKAAKDLAEKEEKVDGNMSKYLNILNNGDPGDKYQESAQSTAKVMFKSLDKQQKELTEQKAALSGYQNLILSMVDTGTNKMKYGGKMPRKKYANGGDIFDDGVQEGPDDPIEIIPLKSDFNKAGRDLKNIKGVVLHKTAGKANAKNIVSGWNSDNRNASADYIIDKDGTITQVGDLSDTKWHSGKKDVNKQTLGVEIVGESGDNSDMTDAQYKALARLQKDVFAPMGITANNYFGHTQVNKSKGFDFGTDKSIADVLRKAGISDTYTPDTMALNSTSANAGNQAIQNAKATEVTANNTIANTNPTLASNVLTNNNQQPLGITNGRPKQINGIEQIANGIVPTQYGLASKDPAPFSDKVNIGAGNRERDYISPLAIEQIAPELLTIATNKKQAVEQLSYSPELLQTFDLSYQLGRNENQSTFNQTAQLATQSGNVEALTQLAAQKYKADEAYNMQEVQGNAKQKLETYSQNVATLNDAKVKNLALIADQQNKQAAVDFNTRKEDISAFTSISGKVLQNTLENRTYNAYANLFKHYGFDKKGNVTFDPDSVVTKFSPGEANQFGIMAAQQGADAILKGDFNRQFKKVKNSDGSTTTTETLGMNKKIQSEYQTLKNQGFDDALIGNMLRAKYPETITQD